MDNCGDVELFKEKLKFNETKENYDDSLIKALLKCGDSIELELNLEKMKEPMINILNDDYKIII